MITGCSPNIKVSYLWALRERQQPADAWYQWIGPWKGGPWAGHANYTDKWYWYWIHHHILTSFYIHHDPSCILANVSGQVQRIGMIGVFVSVSLPAKNRRIVQTHADKKLMFGHLPHRTFTKCSACQQVHTPWLLCLFLPCFSSFFFRWQLKLLWKLDQTAETDSNDIKSQDAYANFGRAAFNLCFGVEQRNIFRVGLPAVIHEGSWGQCWTIFEPLCNILTISCHSMLLALS